jgi:hypothetical protein
VRTQFDIGDLHFSRWALGLLMAQWLFMLQDPWIIKICTWTFVWEHGSGHGDRKRVRENACACP